MKVVESSPSTLDQQRVGRRNLYWEAAKERGRLLGIEMELGTGTQILAEADRHAAIERNAYLRSFDRELAAVPLNKKTERKKLRNKLSSTGTKLRRKFNVAALAPVLERLHSMSRKAAYDFCTGIRNLPQEDLLSFPRIRRAYFETLRFIECCEANVARRVSLYDLLMGIAETDGEKEEQNTIESWLDKLVARGDLGPADRNTLLSELGGEMGNVASQVSHDLTLVSPIQTEQGCDTFHTGPLCVPSAYPDSACLEQEQPWGSCDSEIFYFDPQEVTDKSELSFPVTTGGHVYVPSSDMSLLIDKIVEVSTPRLAILLSTTPQDRPRPKKTLTEILKKFPALHENRYVREAIRGVGKNASAAKSNKTLVALFRHYTDAVSEYADLRIRLDSNNAALAEIHNVQQMEACARIADAA